MPKTKIIAVDTGNRYIKTAHFVFTAGLISHGVMPPAISSVETILYNGQYYSLTETRDAYRRDKTTDETYRILTMAAIAKELLLERPNPGDKLITENVTLAMGLPVAHLQQMREKYASYFEGTDNTMEFEYNKTPFRIHIDGVHVLPQGYSAITANTSLFEETKKYARTYVIDIGGYTTDISLLIQGKPDAAYVESAEMGVIHLINKVKVAIQEECGVEIDDIAAEALFRGDKEAKSNPELVKVAMRVKREYTDALIRTLREKKVDFAASYLVFMGGGAIMMADDIHNAIHHQMVHIVKDVNANAVGYEKLIQRQLLRKTQAAAESTENEA